ncbi:MAG: hypothetical protein JWO54_663 [Candidatus Saccharibacteria bacterium]|nr:hypothetical protein [Candidatus Saccharibacteria bacterium]
MQIMFKKKTPDTQPDTFSVSSLTDKDALFDNYRQQRDAKQTEQENLITESYDNLSPEDREAKIRYDNNLKAMLKDKASADKKSGRRTYSPRSGVFASDRSYDSRFSGSGRGSAIVAVGSVAIIVASITIPGLLVDSFYGEESATQYIEENGYTNVELTGKSTMLVGIQGCDNNDFVKYSFEATALNGVDTTVMVCKGLFKSATIRD